MSGAQEERVVLVNARDEAIGTAGKLEAHRKGLLHRAISVFIFNRKGELLLQRRAEGKYHSAGLWTNTCCSHPRENEDVAAAAVRRLKEEMGIVAPLEWRFSFTYHAHFENGLQEHEFDHVFFGRSELTPLPDPEEVAEWRWASIDAIRGELAADPDRFTAWFQEVWPRIETEYASLKVDR